MSSKLDMSDPDFVTVVELRFVALLVLWLDA